MPEPDCFLRYRINAGTRNFTSGKSHVYVLARPAAAATSGFKIVVFTQPSKHFCRRYMRSTESPSSCTYIFRGGSIHKLFGALAKLFVLINKNNGVNFVTLLYSTAEVVIMVVHVHM